MRIPIRILVVLMAVVALVQSADAQKILPRPNGYVFQNDAASKLVAEAFVQPYGRAIINEFASALNDSANAECLNTRYLSKGRLSERAREMLLKRGTYMMERLDSTTDQAVFKRNLR